MSDMERIRLNDKQKQLLKNCRYYKGEKECPKGFDQNQQMLWFYESCWVRNGASSECIDEYKAYGLGRFCENDGVSIGLKALLFNRYAKGAYSMSSAVDGFKDFYQRYYFS